VIDPIDQISARYIANEKKERIGSLIKVPVPQIMTRQRTLTGMVRLRAPAAALFISAIMKMP
jgi:hypothetical protein